MLVFKNNVELFSHFIKISFFFKVSRCSIFNQGGTGVCCTIKLNFPPGVILPKTVIWSEADKERFDAKQSCLQPFIVSFFVKRQRARNLFVNILEERLTVKKCDVTLKYSETSFYSTNVVSKQVAISCSLYLTFIIK